MQDETTQRLQDMIAQGRRQNIHALLDLHGGDDAE